MDAMESLDIVDDQDQVIGSAERDEIYAKKLPHRIVHVLIFNSKGEMLLQKRSKTVSFAPSHWSTAVGGHVKSGESYGVAAEREFEEELGVVVPMSYGFKDIYDNNAGLKKFIVTFTAEYEGPFEIDTDAVESVAFISLDEIRRMIAEGEKFHPELLFLLKNHYA